MSSETIIIILTKDISLSLDGNILYSKETILSREQVLWPSVSSSSVREADGGDRRDRGLCERSSLNRSIK